MDIWAVQCSKRDQQEDYESRIADIEQAEATASELVQLGLLGRVVVFISTAPSATTTGRIISRELEAERIFCRPFQDMANEQQPSIDAESRFNAITDIIQRSLIHHALKTEAVVLVAEQALFEPLQHDATQLAQPSFRRGAVGRVGC